MGNDLVVAATSGELAQMPIGKYLCTLDPKGKGNAGRLMRAVQQKVPSIMDAVNMELEVTDLLYHRITVTDETTGEVKELPRMVLFCKDGSIWSTSGAKACRDILLPATLLGLELPYSPPQRFRVRREKVNGAERYYASLEWIEGGKK